MVIGGIVPLIFALPHRRRAATRSWVRSGRSPRRRRAGRHGAPDRPAAGASRAPARRAASRHRRVGATSASTPGCRSARARARCSSTSIRTPSRPGGGAGPVGQHRPQRPRTGSRAFVDYQPASGPQRRDRAGARLDRHQRLADLRGLPAGRGVRRAGTPIDRPTRPDLRNHQLELRVGMTMATHFPCGRTRRCAWS